MRREIRRPWDELSPCHRREFFGISATTAAITLSAVSVAATGYGMYQQNEAAKNAASVDNATAQYNAKYDESLAAQLDLDTLQNVRTARQNNDVYLSKEAASYASAGVLATSGSALHAQITNAGKFEQQIQQQYVNSQQQQQGYYSKAQVGILAGQAQASADRLSGSIALINGAAKIAGNLAGDYNAGMFSGLGGGSGYDQVNSINTLS